MPKTFVYENDFFTIKEKLTEDPKIPYEGSTIPKTPWMSVQFRSTANNDWNKNVWTEVANRVRSGNANQHGEVLDKSKDGFYLNSYVENCTIEDTGMQRCNLTLFDPDFTRLENIIIQSYLSVRSLNELSKKLNKETDEAYLQFSRDKTTAINFRVRFGYTEQASKEELVESTNAKDEKWLNRVNSNNKSKVSIRSPWLYFQIINLNFNTTRKGIKINIEAISTSRGWIDFVKVIQRNVMVTGTPTNVIKQFGQLIFKASMGNVAVLDHNAKVYFSEDTQLIAEGVQQTLNDSNLKKEDIRSHMPEKVTVSDPEQEGSSDYEIQVSLGSSPRQRTDSAGRPTGEVVREYMGLRNIFNQISQKVPKRYKSKVTEEKIDTQDVIDEEVTDKSKLRVIPYKWQAVEVDGITFVSFRYIDEQEKVDSQQFFRVYKYGFVHDSIITNFNINSKIDFAQLNVPIGLKQNGEEMKFYVGAGNEEQEGNDITVSASQNVTDKFQNLLNNGNFALVSDVKDSYASDVSSPTASQTLADEIISQLNDGVFEGSIELFGDPFYLFDTKLKPYEYGIKIDFLRPGTLTGDRSYILTSSYLSGIYLVTKISHTIGSGGYKTILEVKRFSGTLS